MASVAVLGHMRSQASDATILELTRIAQTHLRPEDLALFERVTGGSVAALLENKLWQRTSRQTMKKIMGINKVVAHPLNANGLHALRSLLSERIADHVRRARGFSVNHPLYKQFMTDGILVFPDVQNVSSTLDGLFGANDRQIERVLRMVSGFQRLGADGFTAWDTHTHVATDPQYYMHVDTYHPSGSTICQSPVPSIACVLPSDDRLCLRFAFCRAAWKIFVFKKTSLDQGPLHYVYGSHRSSSEGKMRWLHNRTRGLLHPSQTPLKTVDALGPFGEATHGFHPSLRVVGFEPTRHATEGARGLPDATFRSFGFPSPTPIVTGEGMTLVVVDVSGLHFRGWARPGMQRFGSGFAGKGGGCLMCIPRKNPFHCEKLPPDC